MGSYISKEDFEDFEELTVRMKPENIRLVFKSAGIFLGVVIFYKFFY